MSTTGRNIFLTPTPTDFRRDVPGGPVSRSHGQRIQRECDRQVKEATNYLISRFHLAQARKFVDLQTVKQVLCILKEGGMDVVGFLDALCWGNPLAVKDPTPRSARTILMHSNRLATVVSRWLCPPRTSQGGSRSKGARPCSTTS